MPNNDSRRYDDMLHLPHHQSSVHPHMSNYDRAAQFSPFAALTGYGDAVKETARLTDSRAELDESAKEDLSGRLGLLRELLPETPEVTLTYFRPDEKKTGGVYVTATGAVRRIDEYRRTILMSDGTVIPLDELRQIEGAPFEDWGL